MPSPLSTISRALGPALALGALLLQAPAQAQTPPAAGGASATAQAWQAQRCAGAHWHHRGAWIRRLGLSTEQRERIRAILRRARADAEPVRGQLRALGEQERRLFAAPTVDVAALQKLQQQREPLLARASEQRLQTRIAIAEVMTPEQRQRAAQAWREHAHGGARRGPMHGPIRGPAPMPGASGSR
ncbi:MAG: periplasmic heavy metal sensor [Betaproteobacteria bacterium]|nr:periplasmic heavy metal sensor [Betaproteobacteria bacterium]